MRRGTAFAAAACLLVASGCIKTNDHSVTVTLPVPSAPPSATDMIRDGLLATKVRAQIVAVDVDAAARLGVHVHAGVVRLGGVVRTESERTQIGAAVRKVGGVKDVQNDITVNPRAKTFSGGDFALAARVTATLAAQIGINAANLRASAEDGVVTLSGHVPSASIKETALETVRKVDGVKRVVDKIVVR